MLGQLVNNCNERSILSWVDETRSAEDESINPLTIFIPASTGILMPATPGRYKLAVAMGTEPEPVESEAFILPCSNVSNVKFEFMPESVKPTWGKVSFKVGNGGALDENGSRIYVKFSKGFDIGNIPAESVRVNGAEVSKEILTEKDTDGVVLSIPTPVNVDNESTVSVEFSPKCNFYVDSSAPDLKISVATSSEPNFIQANVSSFPKKPNTLFDPPEEMINSDILITIPIEKGKDYPENTKCSLRFPSEFSLSLNSTGFVIEVNRQPTEAIINKDNNSLDFTFEKPVKNNISIFIKQENQILNPQIGTYGLNLTVGRDVYECGKFSLVTSLLFIGRAQLSESVGGTRSYASILFKPSSRCQLKAEDWILFTFPQDTLIPEIVTTYQIRIGNAKPLEVEIDANKIKATLLKPITASKPVKVDFLFKMRNPRNWKDYSIAIETSKGDIGKSEPFDLKMTPLDVDYKFLNSKDAICKGWFQEPPVVRIESLNPEAKVYYWFDDNKDNYIEYRSEFKINKTLVNTTLRMQADYNGERGMPRSINILIDTVSPMLNLQSLAEEITLTNKKVFTISGTREPSYVYYPEIDDTILYYDEVYLAIKNNVLALAFLQNCSKNSSRKPSETFSADIVLEEGSNKLTFMIEDQACNKSSYTKEIILDTKPPVVEIMKPNLTNAKVGDMLSFDIKTEKNTNVFIDGMIVNQIKTEDKETITYTFTHKAQKGKNDINVKVVDQAGNATESLICYFAEPIQIKIIMTIGQKNWSVDGVSQKPLVVAPTTSFDNPKHKLLNGTTYLPISTLAPLLDTNVDWDAKNKKITLTQNKFNGDQTTIEMWLEKTVAKINGENVDIDTKKKLYPVSINGKTMLPLRFIAENLGADILFDAKTKQIKVAYPRNYQ